MNYSKKCSKLWMTTGAESASGSSSCVDGVSRVVPRRGGLITVHELHQTIREIGQELSIDDVRFSSVV